MATITNTSGEYLDRQKVQLENLMPWDIGFQAYATPSMIAKGGFVIDGGHFIYIEDKKEYQYKKGFFKMTVEELCEQINAGNSAFVGTDGFGKHALCRINDLDLYRVAFDMPDAKELPLQLTQEEVEKLLKVSNAKKFDEEMKNLVVTQSEKKAFAHFMIYHPKLKEFPLMVIRQAEEHVGFNILD